MTNSAFTNLIIVFFISSVTLVFVSCNSDENKPIVKTPLGLVQGYIQPSHAGRKFAAFEGIPYAKAPIGERRFQEPEPIEPWDGVWDAIYVTQCAQVMYFNPNTSTGEEDCLFMNVYVPRSEPNPSEKLDVIVHIHGGGYMMGSGHSYAHPEFFMDHEVIFVTFNYRLGILGFLSTEDDVIPGNNGLKDQVLALKWVQKNIASFGGNPDSVTLTGLSAGATSVHLHFLSNMSKGLFHRGFSQSGVALNSFTIQEEPLNKARKLAEAVGCPSGYSQVLSNCLKQRNHRHLLSKTVEFLGYGITPFAPFAPVIEKGSNPFLNKSPYQLLVEGKVQDVPWLVSNTAHEGMFPLAYFLKNLQEIDEKWEELAPLLLDFNYTVPKLEWKKVAGEIRKFYLGEEKINEESFLKVVKMFGDRLFTVDAEVAVKMHAGVTRSPVYYYYFSYPGDHSRNNTVSHGDDGQYFFYNMFQRKEISPNEIKMKDVMVDMVISFARTGKPNIPGVEWKPTSYDELTYLNITSFHPKEMKVETVELLTPVEFWKSLKFRENEHLVPVKDEL